ncbi:hypothetical protein [Nocardia asteroides]
MFIGNSTVVLFGSMLDPARERVSDVDVAVSLARNGAVYEAPTIHR